MAKSLRKRSYDDGCAVAHGLNLIGERWAMLVIRELLLGPKRFTDLREALPGVSAAVLSQRLEDLEAAGVLHKRTLPPPAPVQVYELTDWGYDIEPVFQTLGRWSARSPHMAFGAPMSVSSVVLSMRTMVDRTRIGDTARAVQLRLNGEPIRVTLARRALKAERGEHPSPEVTVTTDPNSFAAMLYGKVPVEAMEAQGAVTLSGERAALQDLLDAFPGLGPGAGPETGMP